MHKIFALARITFLNGIRKNAVWGLCLFSLLLEACGILFMDFFGHDLGRTICDFQFSIMWLAGMIFVLFYAVQAVAWDDEHRTIDSILARPISRSEYVFGSVLGLSLLLLSIELLLGGLAYSEILIIQPMVGEGYFPIFSSSHFFMAWIALQLILLTHIAVVMLVSAAIRGAFPVMLITLAYTLICSGLPVVRESIKQQATNADSAGIHQLLQGMSMLFPDFGMLDLKNSVVSTQSIDSIIGMSPLLPLGMLSIYLATILLLTCIIYHRRDIL